MKAGIALSAKKVPKIGIMVANGEVNGEGHIGNDPHRNTCGAYRERGTPIPAHTAVCVAQGHVKK